MFNGEGRDGIEEKEGDKVDRENKEGKGRKRGMGGGIKNKEEEIRGGGRKEGGRKEKGNRREKLGRRR